MTKRDRKNICVLMAKRLKSKSNIKVDYKVIFSSNVASGWGFSRKNTLATHASSLVNYRKIIKLCRWFGVSVKAGTPPGTPGTHPEPPEPHPEHPEPYPEHPEPHPEHPEPYPEHPEPYPEHPEPYPEHPEPHPEHPEPHPEHAGIRAMKQRTCFSINSRVSH